MFDNLTLQNDNDDNICNSVAYQNKFYAHFSEAFKSTNQRCNIYRELEKVKSELVHKIFIVQNKATNNDF